MKSLAARPKKVVVIDDEPDNVEMTVLILKAAGHQAFGAGDAASGTSLAIEQGADIVVLDYLMPSASGGEVGRALRANERTQQIKIVMCSGTAEHTVRAKFDAYDVFLSKPLDGRHFLDVIAAL